MADRKSIAAKSAAIATLIALVTVIAYFGIQQTAAFKMAKASILASAEAKELGEPVVARLRFFGYSMRVTDSSGTAEFAMNVAGQRGNAVAHVRLKKRLGEWSVVESKLIWSGTTT